MHTHWVSVLSGKESMITLSSFNSNGTGRTYVEVHPVPGVGLNSCVMQVERH